MFIRTYYIESFSEQICSFEVYLCFEEFYRKNKTYIINSPEDVRIREPRGDGRQTQEAPGGQS